MPFHPDPPTDHQLAILHAARAATSAPQLASAAGVSFNTAARALAGCPVHPLTLKALLEAAARLVGAPAANDNDASRAAVSA